MREKLWEKKILKNEKVREKGAKNSFPVLTSQKNVGRWKGPPAPKCSPKVRIIAEVDVKVSSTTLKESKSVSKFWTRTFSPIQHGVFKVSDLDQCFIRSRTGSQLDWAPGSGSTTPCRSERYEGISAGLRYYQRGLPTISTRGSLPLNIFWFFCNKKTTSHYILQ